MLSAESAEIPFIIDKTSYEECPICLEFVKETDRTVLKCGHVFHSSCFMENVLQSNNTCCLCRTEVSRKADQLPDLNKETINNFIESTIVTNKQEIRKCLKDLFNDSSSTSDWNELSKKKKGKKVNTLMTFLVEYGIGMGISISKWIEAGNDRINFDEEDDSLFNIDVQSIIDGDNESESSSDDDNDPNGIIELVHESFTEEIFESFPKSLTVSGRIGEFEEYMGIYIREEGKIVRNAPLYTMIVPPTEGRSQRKMFLFKGNKGNWMLTDEEDDLSKSICAISTRSRDVIYPNDIELEFEYSGDDCWIPDPLIKIRSNDEGEAEEEEESAEGVGYPLFYDYTYHNKEEFICDNVREFLQHYHLSHFQSRISRNDYLLDIDNFLSADIETFMWPEGGSGIRPLFTRAESETIMHAIIEYFSQFHMD